MKALNLLNHRNEFGSWLNQNGLVGRGVEVGTWRGDYAEIISRQWVGNLVTVDPYDWPRDPSYIDGSRKDWDKEGKVDLDPEAIWQVAFDKLKPIGTVIMLRERSVQAAKMFDDGSLDFVYLDGNHSPEAIREDMAAWLPKVKKGGIFCGHDLLTRVDHEMKCGVLDAVWDFAEKIGRRPHVTQCTSWWFQL